MTRSCVAKCLPDRQQLLLCVGAVVSLQYLLLLQGSVNPIYYVFLCTEVPVVLHLICRLRLKRFAQLVVSHLACAVCVAIGDVLFLSWNSAWCCVREAASEELCQHLNAVGDTLDRFGTVHWLCKGSLLAAIRSGHPIPWSTDEDVCVLEDVSFGARLQAAGFEVLSTEHRPINRVLLRSQGANLAVMWVDLFDFKRFNLSDSDDSLIALSSSHIKNGNQSISPRSASDSLLVRKMFSSNKYMPLSERQLFPLEFRKYCGRNWHVPRDASAVLKTVYGGDWRSPRRDAKFIGARVWTCELWMDGCGANGWWSLR